MKKLIPNFMTSKKSSSSSSSSSSSIDPLSQSIKAKKASPSQKEEALQIDVTMLSPSWPSMPSKLPPLRPLVLESELQLAFHRFDTDGDGQISPAEVRAILRCVGDEVTEDEAAYIVREADTNGDGFMDLHEFIDFVMRRPKPPSPPLGPTRVSEEEDEEEELQCVFRLFDKDKNGFISAEELHAMLWNLGEREVSLQDCAQMIHNVDCNKDGVVDFQEFKAMMIVNTCA